MLKKYLVPCVTENVNIVTDFRSTLPTTCPNNNTHVINENGIYAITSISENKVVIDEGIDVPSGGYFRVDNHEMDIVGATTVAFVTAFGGGTFIVFGLRVLAVQFRLTLPFP